MNCLGDPGPEDIPVGSLNSNEKKYFLSFIFGHWLMVPCTRILQLWIICKADLMPTIWIETQTVAKRP